MSRVAPVPRDLCRRAPQGSSHAKVSFTIGRYLKVYRDDVRE